MQMQLPGTGMTVFLLLYCSFVTQQPFLPVSTLLFSSLQYAAANLAPGAGFSAIWPSFTLWTLLAPSCWFIAPLSLLFNKLQQTFSRHSFQLSSFSAIYPFPITCSNAPFCTGSPVPTFSPLQMQQQHLHTGMPGQLPLKHSLCVCVLETSWKSELGTKPVN